MIPVTHDGNLRLREVESLSQGHTATKKQREGRNLVLFDSEDSAL